MSHHRRDGNRLCMLIIIFVGPFCFLIERDSPGFELMGQQHPEADGAREPQNAGKSNYLLIVGNPH